MRITRLNALLAALALATAYTSAKEVTGFLTGSGENLSPGIYRMPLESEGTLTQVSTWTYALHGGAYGDHNYWVLMGQDLTGYVMDGLWAFDPVQGTVNRRMVQEYGCTDMTWDCSTGDLYGILCHRGGMQMPHELVRIETLEGTPAKVGQLNGKFMALACDLWGNMYAMASDGVLFKVDQTTGKTTRIGSTSLRADLTEVQSMEFDRDTGELWWSFLDMEADVWLAKIDPATGQVLTKHRVNSNALLGALHIPYTETTMSSPGTVSDLSAQPGEADVTFSWRMPEYTISGGALAGPLKLEIRRGGVLVMTLENLQPGAEATWTDTTAPTGEDLRYAFTCYEQGRRGESVFTNVHIGADVAAAPSEVKAVASGTDGVTLTWQAPATDRNGLAQDPAQLTYRVTRTPDAREWTGLTATTLTDSGLKEYNMYTYTVYAINAQGEGAGTAGEPVAAGPAIAMPWYPDLTSAETEGQFTVLNLNDDNYYWTRKDGRYLLNTTIKKADDWLITPPLHLEAGVNYKLTYSLETGASTLTSTENLRVTLGTDATPESHTTVIRDLNAFKQKTQTLEETLTVDKSGDYTLGFYGYSDHSWDRWQILLGDLSIEPVGAIDLKAESLTGPGDVAVGEAAVYTLTVSNHGTQAQTGYQASLIDSEGNTLATASSTAAMEPGATSTLTLSWTPMHSEVTELRARVEKEGDVNAVNDLSPVISLRYMNPGQRIINVGVADSEPDIIPFNFEDLYCWSQSIYGADEINYEGGLIKGIAWRYDNPGAKLADKDVKIYMANTTKPVVVNHFTTEDAMTLVYDGKATFESGKGLLYLELDNPYPYTGGNLMVMTNKVNDATTGVRVTFQAQNFPETPRTLVTYNTSGTLDPMQGLVSSMLPCISLTLESEGGRSLTGKITCDGSPVSGVDVSIPALHTATVSKADGTYTFGWLAEGDYDMQFEPSFYGWLATSKTITHSAGGNYDVELQARPSTTLEGVVTDTEGNPVAGAAVMVKGWDTQTLTTDEEGRYKFVQLYAHDNTLTEVWACGYRSASSAAPFPATEPAKADFTLQAIHNPVHEVTVEAGNEEALVSWTPVDFGYDMALDTDSPEHFTINSQGVYSLAKRFDGPMAISSVSWHSAMAPTLVPGSVDLYIFTLDSEGNPQAILYKAEDCPNRYNSWNEHTLPQLGIAPNGVLIALVTKGNLYLSKDATPAEGSYLIDLSSGSYSALTDDKGAVNLMIRPHAARFNPLTGYAEPEVSYNLYRLPAEGEQQPETHELVASPAVSPAADTAWTTLPDGDYKYAVEAVYTDGKASGRVFSESVKRDSTSLDSLEGDVPVLVTEGGLTLGCTADIYTPEGLRVATAVSGKVALDAGIYIVTTPKGAVKVSIR